MIDAYDDDYYDHEEDQAQEAETDPGEPVDPPGTHRHFSCPMPFQRYRTPGPPIDDLYDYERDEDPFGRRGGA